MLKKVWVVDWDASFDFAPPSRESVINTEHVVSAVPVDETRSRVNGPSMRVRFADGSSLHVKGKLEDLL